MSGSLLYLHTVAHDLIPSGLLWAPIYIKLNKVELSSRCSVFCFYGFLPPFLQVQSWRWCIMTRQFWKTTISLWASNCCRRKTVTSSRTSARNRETLSARWWLTWWERCPFYAIYIITLVILSLWNVIVSVQFFVCLVNACWHTEKSCW